MQLKAPILILFLVPFYLLSQTKPQEENAWITFSMNGISQQVRV